MCFKKFQSLTSINIIVNVLSKRCGYFYYFIQKITQKTKSLWSAFKIEINQGQIRRRETPGELTSGSVNTSYTVPAS